MLRGQIYEADAVLIGIHETNNSVSSVLTNAYNWIYAVIKEKPVGLIAIENNQDKFRAILNDSGVYYMNKP